MKKEFKKEPDIKSEPQPKPDPDIKPESDVRGIHKRDYSRISTKSKKSNLPNLNKILNLSSAVKKKSATTRKNILPTERTGSKFEKKKKEKKRR